MYKLLITTILLFFCMAFAYSQTGLYSVEGSVVNVRSGPGTQYSVIGSFKRGESVTVKGVADDGWARVDYHGNEGYMSLQYISFVSSLSSVEGSVDNLRGNRTSDGGFWDDMFGIVKVILWICAILTFIGSVFESEKLSIFSLPLVVCGIGALIGKLFFGSGRAGADIGMMLVVVLIIKMVANSLDSSGLSTATYIGWFILSLPFYILDRLQFFLSKPWRGLLKRDWITDNLKPAVRTVLNVLKIPFYIAIFPLRFINAVYYNLIVHNLYEFSNYLLEVVIPSDQKEGARNMWRWIIGLPRRIGKYMFYHYCITFIESVLWTVIDTFVPALTLYHGTQKTATDSMLSDPYRNSMRENERGWLSGIWNVGGGNYAGDGIYFGIYRRTLWNYQNGSAIVARVTMGRTIDVSLMPGSVNIQAGHPNAKAVSNWGLDNGYVTGEWWRSDRDTKWWEICLYDRQNRYNDSWRIRPIYAINSNSGIMQRIPGGTAHWLFRKMAWNDFLSSLRKFLDRMGF